jgi:L-asparagine oxygenase
MLSHVMQDGFGLIKELAPDLSTMQVARSLGSVVDIEALLPASGIPTVQSLRPRDTSESRQNRYSGNYGLGGFPLHSDLAHWCIPPPYVLLRCIVGTKDVFTNMLSWTGIVHAFGTTALQKAVFTGRNRRLGCSSLVVAMSHHHRAEVFRWDPIFLKPLNKPAQELTLAMRDPTWYTAEVQVLLERPGDTLLLDNWRMLHGRGRVLAHSTPRHLERIYLSEIFPRRELPISTAGPRKLCLIRRSFA